VEFSGCPYTQTVVLAHRTQHLCGLTDRRGDALNGKVCLRDCLARAVPVRELRKFDIPKLVSRPREPLKQVTRLHLAKRIDPNTEGVGLVWHSINIA
jgi:hypothetical protein